MTAAQERRLLLAALDYAAADEDVRIARKIVRDHRNDYEALRAPEGDEVSLLHEALKARRASKTRLLRAAGQKREQPLLPLEKTRDRMRRK